MDDNFLTINKYLQNKAIVINFDFILTHLYGVTEKMEDTILYVKVRIYDFHSYSRKYSNLIL